MTIVEALDEPVLAELYRYWSALRRGRMAPARADIDPVEIPQLLPHIALTEVVAGSTGKAPRFRYRLAGTQIERRFGCPLTNRYLDDLKQGGYLQFVRNLYNRLVAEAAPVYAENSFRTGDSGALQVKRLLLPLSDDGATVNMVLAGIVYSDSDNDLGHKPTVLDLQHSFRESAPDTG